MKCKAKTLKGKWVIGEIIGNIIFTQKPKIKSDSVGHWTIESAAYRINTSTICEQVRGTEFFEGDEVRFEIALDLKRCKLIGRIVWNEQLKGFMIQNYYSSDRYQICEVYKIKPTGKNKHD